MSVEEGEVMARKKKRHDPKRVVGYIRVSTARQDISPEVQREALAGYCAREAAELVAVFEDQVSGGAELDKRVGMLGALAACKEHAAGTLLVMKRDRLSREPMVAAFIEKLAKDSGAKLQQVEGPNGDGPEDQLMRGIADLFAQYERAQIASRTRAALARKKAKGERLGTLPYGYGATVGKLVPRPQEQEVIERIRAERIQGATIQSIVDQLNHDRVPARGERWHRTTLARILNREAA